MIGISELVKVTVLDFKENSYAYSMLKFLFEIRGVFKVLSSIYDAALCESNQWFLAVNYYCKKNHHRYLTGSQARLRLLKH